MSRSITLWTDRQGFCSCSRSRLKSTRGRRGGTLCGNVASCSIIQGLCRRTPVRGIDYTHLVRSNSLFEHRIVGLMRFTQHEGDALLDDTKLLGSGLRQRIA